MTLTLVVAVSSCVAQKASTKPDPENLSKQLLELTDLDTKWDETHREIFTTRGAENGALDSAMTCPQAELISKSLKTLAGESGADVEMQLKEVTNGAITMGEQAWSNDNSIKYFKAVKEVVTLCDGKKWTEEKGVASEFDLLPSVDEGDESVSWSTVSTPPPATENEKPAEKVRHLVMRVGNVILLVQSGSYSILNEGPELPLADWNVLVARATQKMTRVKWK